MSELETEIEGEINYTRQASLSTLMVAHQSTVDAFIRSEGFGNFRSPPRPLHKEHIDIPVTESIAMACVSPENIPPTDGDSLSLSSGDDSADSMLSGLSETTASRAALEGMHARSFVEFSNPSGFGYVASRHQGDATRATPDLTRVIGFQRHAFRQMPKVEAAPASTRWSVQEVQLVSLLKHRPAAVYLSPNLPRMEELVEAKTRPVDAFESAALDRLSTGEDLVAAEHHGTIRMVGSIRAVRHCLECHRVNRGTLLGAFVYRLQKENAAAERRDE